MADDAMVMTMQDVLRAVAAGDLSVEEAEARLASLEDEAMAATPVAAAAPPLTPPPRASATVATRARRAGRARRSVDDAITFAAHGVERDLLRALQECGYADLPASEIVLLADHGVDPEFVREVHRAGIRATAEELTAMVDHGVDTEWLTELPESVIADLAPADLILMADHGLSPDDLEAFLDLRAEGDDADDANGADG